MKTLTYYATERIDTKMREDMRFYNFIAQSLGRFKNKDWGYLCEEDKEINNMHIEEGIGSILGVYKFMGDGEIVWIIRDDPSNDYVTILYPEER